MFVLVLNAAAEPSLGSRVFEANFFSCVVLCYSLGTNVFKKQGGMLSFFFACVFTNFQIRGLVFNAAAEPSLGSRAFETNC